jgi:hypothetical protein
VSNKIKRAKRGPSANVADTIPAGQPVVLPDLPHTWLVQLKESLRQDNKKMFWATVAGSSVIAASLTILSSFLLEGYKANLNHDLEKYKIELQQQNKVRNETFEAYSVLLGQIDKLDETLDEYILTCLAAAKQPNEKELTDAAKESWDALSDQIGEVTTAKGNNKIDAGLAGEIDSVIGSILENQPTPKAPHNNPALVDRQKELKQGIIEIKKKLQKTKNNLVLNS